MNTKPECELSDAYTLYLRYCEDCDIPALTAREWQLNGCPDGERYHQEARAASATSVRSARL